MRTQLTRVAALEHKARIKTPKPLTPWQELQNVLVDIRRRVDSWECYHRYGKEHCYAKHIGLLQDEADMLREVLREIGGDECQDAKDVRELVTKALELLPIRTADEMSAFGEEWTPTWANWIASGVDTAGAGCIWRLGETQHYQDESE